MNKLVGHMLAIVSIIGPNSVGYIGKPVRTETDDPRGLTLDNAVEVHLQLAAAPGGQLQMQRHGFPIGMLEGVNRVTVCPLMTTWIDSMSARDQELMAGIVNEANSLRERLRPADGPIAVVTPEQFKQIQQQAHNMRRNGT